MYEFFKRVFDLVMSILLLVFCLPVLIIIALLIKLDSNGPILYRHKRVGKDGKLFYVYKFRTMRVKSDKDTFKQITYFVPKKNKPINDPRLTKIGKFLRMVSLDELPHLFNVFKGEMSLVGPRPPMVYEFEHYNEYERTRMKCKPGIIGLSQLSRAKTYKEMIEKDIFYVNHRSFWIDLKTFFSIIIVPFKKI